MRCWDRLLTGEVNLLKSAIGVGLTNREHVREQCHCSAEFVLGHHWRAPTLPSAGNGSNQAGAGPLLNEVALELAESAEDVEHQSATGSGRVDCLCMGAETHIASL